MSADKNEVHLVGNLGKDPDMKFTQAGAAVCRLSIATTFAQGDKKITEWHRVTGWKEVAERMGDLRKGDRISLHGRLHYSTYDKGGVKMYATEVVAYEFARDGEQKSKAQKQDDDSPDSDMPY